MKIKTTFVTNSSSASFMIQRHNLTPLQIELIYNHIEVAAIILPSGRHKNQTPVHYLNDSAPKFRHYSDEWEIREDDTTIKGWTSMDNFDMLWYLTEVLGINEDDIDYDGNENF